MNRWVAISIIAALIAMGAAAMSLSNSHRTADVVASVLLQAMQRGYECHAEGRSLSDCQNEQRKRWEANR